MLALGVELDELVSERKISFVFFSVAYSRNELSHFALGHYTSLGFYTTLWGNPPSRRSFTLIKRSSIIVI